MVRVAVIVLLVCLVTLPAAGGFVVWSVTGTRRRVQRTASQAADDLTAGRTIDQVAAGVAAARRLTPLAKAATLALATGLPPADAVEAIASHLRPTEARRLRRLPLDTVERGMRNLQASS